MRYTVRWVSYAARQRDDLPRPAHEQLLVALDLLAADPRAGYYDDTNDQWSVTFGELGIILYTIEDPLEDHHGPARDVDRRLITDLARRHRDPRSGR